MRQLPSEGGRAVDVCQQTQRVQVLTQVVPVVGGGDLLFRPVVLAEVHLRLDGFISGLAEGAAAIGPVLVEVVEAAEHI